jgi:tetratricopeptide (TPR) repeat protein
VNRKVIIRMSLVALFAGFLAIDQSQLLAIQDTPPPQDPPAEKPQEPAGEKPQEPTTEKPVDGQADLDQAFELKINATAPKDLDKIVALCQSAIEKGLDENNKNQAVELMASTLVLHAEQYIPRIFSPQRDRRWRVFRREALIRLEKAIEVKPDLLIAHSLIARLQALEGGDVEKANAAISRVIDLAADNPQQLSQALTIRAALAEGDEKQMNDLSQAIKIDSGNIDALKMRSELFLKMKEAEKALEDLESWSKAQPDNVEPAVKIIGVLEFLDRKDDAMKKLDEYIARNPESTLFYAIRGNFHLDKKDNEKALADAEKALQLDKDNADALIIRSIVLADKKDHDGALRDINRYLQLSPGNARGMWIRALVNASKKDYDASIADLEKLSKSFPEVTQYQMQLAAIYNAKEDTAKAVKIYDDLIEDNPEDWELRRGRGDAWLTNGEHEKAIADFEKALELMPEDEADDGVYNNLAWVLSTSTFDNLRNGKRAVELALKACELTEYKAPHILSTLASSYAEIDDFENAKKWAAKAVELQADDPDMQNNLVRELEAYKQGRKWRELQKPGKKDAGFAAPLPGEEPKKEEEKAPEADKPAADKDK